MPGGKSHKLCLNCEGGKLVGPHTELELGHV